MSLYLVSVGLKFQPAAQVAPFLLLPGPESRFSILIGPLMSGWNVNEWRGASKNK